MKRHELPESLFGSCLVSRRGRKVLLRSNIAGAPFPEKLTGRNRSNRAPGPSSRDEKHGCEARNAPRAACKIMTGLMDKKLRN